MFLRRVSIPVVFIQYNMFNLIISNQYHISISHTMGASPYNLCVGGTLNLSSLTCLNNGKPAVTFYERLKMLEK